MSSSQSRQAPRQHVTPPSSFAALPLTPPPTDKSFAQVNGVIALFRTIQVGGHTGQESWTVFQLEPGECDEIERQLSYDETLWGFVKDKIRYVDLEHDRDDR